MITGDSGRASRGGSSGLPRRGGGGQLLARRWPFASIATLGCQICCGRAQTGSRVVLGHREGGGIGTGGAHIGQRRSAGGGSRMGDAVPWPPLPCPLHLRAYTHAHTHTHTPRHCLGRARAPGSTSAVPALSCASPLLSSSMGRRATTWRVGPRDGVTNGRGVRWATCEAPTTVNSHRALLDAHKPGRVAGDYVPSAGEARVSGGGHMVQDPCAGRRPSRVLPAATPCLPRCVL